METSKQMAIDGSRRMYRVYVERRNSSERSLSRRIHVHVDMRFSQFLHLCSVKSRHRCAHVFLGIFRNVFWIMDVRGLLRISYGSR